MKKFYIYRHIRLDTNTPFNVGKGCGKRAYSKSKRNRYWNNIANKVGYRVDIILTGLIEKEAFEKEKEFIKLYKSLGYCETNLTDGGEGISGYKYTGELLVKHRKQVIYHMNRKDVRKKMSEIKKEYFKNSEAKERARTAKLKSLKENPEQFLKISRKLKNIYKDEDKRNNISKIKGGREFVAIDKNKNEIWRGFSQQLCAKKLNIYQSNINKCLSGERKTTGGYCFRYL